MVYDLVHRQNNRAGAAGWLPVIQQGKNTRIICLFSVEVSAFIH
jgi:hypothetical protein